MQLTDIRDDVRILTGIPSNDGRVPDSVLTALINSSLRRITQEHDWPWLYVTDTTNTATVVGTAAYSCEAGFRRTVRVTLGGDRDVQARSPRDLVDLSTINDYPRYFTVENDVLTLAPVPTEIETLEHVYLGSETALSGDTDEPLVPDAYIDLVLFGASYLVHSRLKDTQAFRGAFAEYKDRVRSYADDTRQFTGGVVPKHRNDWS